MTLTGGIEMFFRKQPQPETVASIISDITSKIERLHTLSEAEADRADEVAGEIRTLENEIQALVAKQEAHYCESGRADKLADKFAALLEV